MYSSLLQNISEIVVVISPDGIIRYSNSQLQKALGLPTEEVVGRNIFDFIYPDDVRRATLEYSETVLKPGEAIPSVLRFRDASGVWIPFEIIANNRLNDPDVQGVILDRKSTRLNSSH